MEQKNKIILAGVSVTLLVFLALSLVITRDRSWNEITPDYLSQEATLATAEELKLQDEVETLIKAGDMNACSQIQNDMYKKVCINNIALNKARETNDISYCQYLDNQLIPRIDCERQILIPKSISEEDKTICSETKDVTLKQQCENSFLLGLAQKMNDPKVCDQNADNVNADQCWNGYYASLSLSQLMSKKQSTLECGTFRGVDAKADCGLITSAMKTNNPLKLVESCQNQKTYTFFEFCMMIRNSVEGVGAPNVMPMQ